MNNQKGFITLDFIFALTITIGFCVLFSAITYTLAMVEVTQYVAFATSRAYNGAHVNREAQRNLGKQKFTELRNNGILKSIYDSGWIVINEPLMDDFSAGYQDDFSGDERIFSGVQIPFKAEILDLNIPFLGKSATESTTGKATLNSYLMREVSTQECRELFNNRRYVRLRQLHSSYVKAVGSEKIITDNGC